MLPYYSFTEDACKVAAQQKRDYRNKIELIPVDAIPIECVGFSRPIRYFFFGLRSKFYGQGHFPTNNLRVHVVVF
jgi:hypothetical protein